MEFRKELGSEVTVGNEDIMGDERARTMFSGSRSFAEWGLVAISELILFPRENEGQVQTQKEE